MSWLKLFINRVNLTECFPVCFGDNTYQPIVYRHAVLLEKEGSVILWGKDWNQIQECHVLGKLATIQPWRRQWHPTPVLLPGKSHGQRSLVGCSPWGRWASDTTERLPFHFSFHALEKEMATHSSVLAWRIPGMGEPGGLPSVESHRVGLHWSYLAAAEHESRF